MLTKNAAKQTPLDVLETARRDRTAADAEFDILLEQARTPTTDVYQAYNVDYMAHVRHITSRIGEGTADAGG